MAEPKAAQSFALPEVGTSIPNVPVIGGVLVDLTFLGQSRGREWARRQRAEEHAEMKRMVELRRLYPREVAPELYDRSYQTEEHHESMLKLARGIVVETVKAVRGFTVGQRRLDQVTDPEAIADLLEAAGLLEEVTALCVRHQNALTYVGSLPA